MVNGISSQNSQYAAFYRAAAGNAVVHKNDVENMVKFLNGQPVTSIPEPSVGEAVVGTLPFAGAFGAIQGFSTWKNNGLTGSELDAFKAAKKAGTAKGFNWNETISNVKKAHPYAQRSEAYKAGLDTIKKEYGDFFKKNVTPNDSRAPFGIAKLLDKIPGYTKLRGTGFGKAMGRSGAGWMLAFDAVGKTFSDIIPTFQQLGFSSGMKQVAKSGTQIAAGALGWVAGDAVGTAVGAAIGTAICPGIGTAIGGFLGKFIGGVVGSAVAGKAAKAVTGKNELEKLQEKQLAEVTQQVDADPNTKLALAQQAIQAADEILAQDPNNKDALAAKESAQKVIAEYQAAEIAAQQTASQATTAQGQTSQQNGLNTINGVPVVPGFNGYSYDMNQYTQAMANTKMPIANNQTMAMSNPFLAQQTLTPQIVR